MVGAGGIGCELLKNLVLTGFGEIHIVDMDTIDLSNLNRQFLFGMQHIKKSKAMVAKETAGKFNPNVKLEAHHANIKDPEFNVKWFGGFNVVFNALDNLEARRHVNKMCLSADVPLIESGTTGFDGQVQVIKRGKTECYDCTHKATPKSFPVCTIRSTPSQPIHCIVWAKSYLLVEIFGTSEESSPDLDPTEDSENSREIANLKREAEELKNIREKMDSPDFAATVFNKVFRDDINRLRSMDEMWKSRKPPEALDHQMVSDEAKGIDAKVSENDQKIWSLVENYIMFEDSLRRLAERVLDMKRDQVGDEAAPIITFDKDDEDTLDFVAASANLRSLVFGINVKSKFDIKQMAGNIIPAIATTNAITAGLCVLQAFKVLRDDFTSARTIFLSRLADRAFCTEKPSPPNPTCGVCSVARTAIEADIERATLGDLLDNVLRDGLRYGGEITVMTSQLLYDCDFDDNIDRTLKGLGFSEETFVTVVDDEDDPRINLEVLVTNTQLPEDSTPITIPAYFEIPKKSSAKLETPEPSSLNGNSANGSATKRSIEEVIGSDELDQSNGPDTKKLRRDIVVEDRVPASAKKLGKMPATEMDDIVVIDDDGTITID
ncbi:unnamed protein product [Tuber melanosporum]|uniref:Ubiquitin-activating enzyme E1-like n=1 Tax=Tuber melanosporum (strain Mel28) TaxID=656061 RepID=D5G5L1_TUBMM|nr:uncharacterized protein GSTUM_00004395001 [Tuber melanosporum]CAZ79804.1 unnamed protein product [Tuber melanosporum]